MQRTQVITISESEHATRHTQDITILKTEHTTHKIGGHTQQITNTQNFKVLHINPLPVFFWAICSPLAVSK